METIICSKCHKELPATLDNFFYEKLGKHQLRSKCKRCYSKDDQRYREENKERKREWDKKWYNQNREKRLKQSRDWGKKVMEKSISKLTYQQLHDKIRKLKTKNKFCTICNERKDLVLANISGEYKEDPKDFFWVCKSCHVVYDRVINRGVVIEC
jgi:hypothetical protein